MNLGIMLGGVADGFSKGVQLRETMDENKQKREFRRREQASYDIQQEAGEIGQPKADATAPREQGAITAVINKIDPALAVQTAMGAPAAAPAQPTAGIAAPAPAPAPAAAAPTAEANPPEGEMIARAAVPMKFGETDDLRSRIRAARVGGDTATLNALTPLLVKSQMYDKFRELNLAAMQGEDGLVNYIGKVTNTDVDLTPTAGRDGYFDVTMDGRKTGRSMSLPQMVDWAKEQIAGDPELAQTISEKRDQNDRLNRKSLVDQHDALQAADRDMRDYNLKVDESQRANRTADAQVAGTQATTENTQARTKELTDEAQYEADFRVITAQTAFASQDKGEALLNTNWARKHDRVEIVTNPDTNVVTRVTKNSLREALDASVQAGKEQWWASPYRNNGITFRRNASGKGGIFRVTGYTHPSGVNGGFASLNEAEIIRRRMDAQKPPIPTGR